MTKMARSWSRARMATLLLAAAALSDPAFAKARDRGGFDPHNHLALNVATANELVRGLRAAEGSTAVLPAALDEFERLLALTTRRVLTTHNVIGAGEQGGCGNVNGERS